MEKMGAAVKCLLAVNVIVFAAGVFMPDWQELLLTGFALYFPLHPNFNPWQFVTYAFLHGSMLHIFFNMFALFSFGLIFERLWGLGRFLAFYFACAVGAGVIYTAVNWFEFQGIEAQLIELGMTKEAIDALLATGAYDTRLTATIPAERLQQFYRLYHVPAVGASGAIYGILVAFGITFPNAKLSLIFLPVPIAAKYFIPALIALDLFSGITGYSLFGGGIAHFAHIGGALIGFLLMWHWNRKLRRRRWYDLEPPVD